MSDASTDRSAAEILLVALCLVALVLAAGFLPAFDLFAMTGTGSGTLPGSGSGQGSIDLPSSTPNTSGQSATPERSATPPPSTGSGNASSSAGSPTGGSLSMPDSRSRIGDTSDAPVTSIPRVPLFVVESARDTYWRQAAYTTYTGTAWERSTEWRPVEGAIPPPDRTLGGRELAYRVRLLTDSRSLPVAWQPESVRLLEANATLESAGTGGIRSAAKLPANTTYLARSSRPPRNPDVLRNAGRDYPERIERVYTQLPPETPDEVGEFTERIASGAETPYGVAVAVRDWLKANKAYSLNVSHDPGEPIAAQFLFEMEKGYCQYFATTMVAMLRTQGIPARYVVGFAGGQPVGEDEYLVTSDTGHAWVEVYFPEVGWVRFDPTASGSLPVSIPKPPYDLSLNRSAVAGAPVTISVAKNDSPVVGAPVYVEDERVGWTDATGEVTTRLPYVANVTILARRPGAETKYSDDGERTAARSEGALPPADAARHYQVRGPAPGLLSRTGTNGSVKTYRSETNATLRVRGRLVVGGSAIVNATVRGIPIRGGNVTLDGERVGKTNASGLFELSLSGITAGSHTVRVSRGAVSATTNVTIENPLTPTPTPTPTPKPPDDPVGINVSVAAPLGLPLPGGPATVTVERNGSPVPGAVVRVAGSRVGVTDENGTLPIGLPLAGSGTVVATGPRGTTAQTRLTGLFRNVLIVLGALLAIVAVPAGIAWRRGITPRGLSRRIATWTSMIARRIVDALLRFADGVVGMAERIRAGLRRFGSWLVSLPAAVAARGLAAFRDLDPRRLVRLLVEWVRRLLQSGGTVPGNDRTESVSSSPDGGDVDGSADGAPATLRDLWREFVGFVAPPRRSTRTPGEIARYAVDRGLPERPVRVLTDLYRDAEYGGSTPEASRLERAREALADIRKRGRDQ